MAQPFQCLCNTSACRGTISGASQMNESQLQGLWLNNHIREMLTERSSSNGMSGNGAVVASDPTAKALRDAVTHAEKVVDAARVALETYVVNAQVNGSKQLQSAQSAKLAARNGLDRRGPTSRELSGEMSGDTVRV